MNTKVAALVAAVALLFGGGGFVAGMTLAPAPSPGGPARDPSAFQQRVLTPGGQAPGGGLPGGQPAGGGLTSGRVISVGNGSLTIEVAQPGGETARSVIALVGESTRVVRTVETPAALSDIAPGEQVTVVGTTDQASGTISAGTVMIGGSPAIRRAGPSPTPGAP
ncbi:MAG: hypothetical protein WEE03_02770 [Chloroflexota bacterium]